MELAPWLSQSGFLALTHVPVELIRAICAVAITIATFQVLHLSRLELMLKLEHARTLSNLAISSRSQMSNRFETALNSVLEGVVCVDLSGNIEYINWSALFMLGYDSIESMLGKNFFQLCFQTGYCRTTENATDAEEKFLRSRLTTGQETGVFRRENGKGARVRYRVSPILELKRLIGAVIVFTEA